MADYLKDPCLKCGAPMKIGDGCGFVIDTLPEIHLAHVQCTKCEYEESRYPDGAYAVPGKFRPKRPE